MKKSMVIGVAVALFGALVTSAGADTGTLPGGTALSVDIDSPDDLVAGEIVLSGEASVGMGAAVKDTSLVYILDVSGSTGGLAGVDCDNNAATADTILSCEKEAVLRVNDEAASANSPVLNSGVGTFNNSGSVVQALTAPGASIEAAVNSINTSSGGTNFGAGLSAANTILSAPSVAGEKIVVFLTDGAGSGTSALPAGTIVKAFAIAGAGCSGNLDAISDECTVVTDLMDLDDVISESIGASIDSLTYTIDGGAPQLLSAVPPLPQAGPVTVGFETSLGWLSLGAHEVCVQATGTDGGGSGVVSDCTGFEVVESTVDCSDPETECMVTSNDGASDATVMGTPSFTKVLGIRAADAGPGDCPSNDCFTGYDVLFGGDGDVGIVEMTVVASSKATSTPPGLAKVYMDGMEITAQCHPTKPDKSPIPCAKITKTKGGLTQYFVRFNADPGFHFK
mgnify:CR=1 FL=1